MASNSPRQGLSAIMIANALSAEEPFCHGNTVESVRAVASEPPSQNNTTDRLLPAFDLKTEQVYEVQTASKTAARSIPHEWLCDTQPQSPTKLHPSSSHPQQLRVRSNSSNALFSKFSSDSDCHGIDLVPECISVGLQTISCTGRHDRTTVKFKLQNTSYSTPVAKELSDHTCQVFEFQTTVHNMAFDTVKIDLFDVKPLGLSTNAARAYLPLRDLQKMVGSKYSKDDRTPSVTRGPDAQTMSEQDIFDFDAFVVEHDDKFEITLPLFKPGSYSKLGSSLRRHSAVNSENDSASHPLHYQSSTISELYAQMGLEDIEVGHVIVEATLRFKSQDKILPPEKTSLVGDSSNGSTTSSATLVVTANNLVDSVISAESPTFRDCLLKAEDSPRLRNHRSCPSLKVSSDTTLPMTNSGPIANLDNDQTLMGTHLGVFSDEGLESLRSAAITPPLSPQFPQPQQSPASLSSLATEDAELDIDSGKLEWRLSPQDESDQKEGFVEDVQPQRQEPAKNFLKSKIRPHFQQETSQSKEEPSPEERKREIELMADIVANGDESKKERYLAQGHNETPSQKGQAATTTTKDKKGLLSLFSKQTLSAFRDIQLLYSSFFGHGWNLSSVEFLRGVHIVEQFYALHQTPTATVVFDDIEMLESARYFARLALASYGSLPWVYFGFSFKVAPLNFLRGNSDRKNVMEYFKLQKEDMVIWHFDKRTALVPSYYIIRDPIHDALCIIIRGTYSITDAMTDLVCEYYPYNGGLVHKGIMDTARFVLERSGQDIKAALERFNLKTIYCIGHSLGAGSASLLCALLQEHFADYVLPSEDRSLPPQKLDIKACLFAPPPVCTPNLATDWESSQMAFVNENDIVCRLSYGNALDLKELIKLGALESLNPAYDGLSSKDKTARIMEVMEKAQASLRAVNDIPRLVLPGKVAYLYKAHESTPVFEEERNRDHHGPPLEGMGEGQSSSRAGSMESKASPLATARAERTSMPPTGTTSTDVPPARSSETGEESKHVFGAPLHFDATSNARSLAVQSILDESSLQRDKRSRVHDMTSSSTAGAQAQSQSQSKDEIKKGDVLKSKPDIRIEYSDRNHFTVIPLRTNWLWHHFPQQYDSRLERALTWAKAQQQQG